VADRACCWTGMLDVFELRTVSCSADQFVRYKLIRIREHEA
jgi:hypothetical protein